MIRSLLFPLLLLLPLFSAAAAEPQDKPKGPTLGEQVNDAIKAGVKFLRTKQKDDGSFESIHTSGFPDGAASLCILALVKSKVSADDPVVQRTLAYLRYKAFTHTYSTAVRIMALDALQDKKQKPAILAAAQWLADNFRYSEREWGYPDRTVDLSNTQYAVMGLWTAEKHGFKTPKKIWSDLVPRIIRHQNKDGGFGYQIGRESSGSMTTAGITVLTICDQHLPKNFQHAAELKESVEKAWAYLERRFHPEGNPIGEHVYIVGNYHYYLYGMERACAFGGRKKLGDIDWYREGAKALVKAQMDNGSWGDPVQTSFALLFLRLSTYTTMRKKHDANLGGPGSRTDKKIRPLIEIPFARHWLVLGPFQDPEEKCLSKDLIGEAKADPRAGQVAKGTKWFEHTAPMDYVNFQEIFGEDLCLAYAFTRFEVSEDCEAVLWFGSDDGSRLWVDGKLVHDWPFRKAEWGDAHSIPLSLSKGRHCLLVKVCNHKARWRFYLRFALPDGKPVPGLVFFKGREQPTVRERFDATAPFLTFEEIYHLLPLDKKIKLEFDSRKDLDRIYIAQASDDRHFFWSQNPDIRTDTRPNPKARGVVCVKPINTQFPARLFRKVRVVSKRTRVMARVSAVTPVRAPEADWIARLGVFDGTMTWLTEELIQAGAKPSAQGWQEIHGNLKWVAGKEVLIVLECAPGGPGGDNFYEQAFIDEFSLKGY